MQRGASAVGRADVIGLRWCEPERQGRRGSHHQRCAAGPNQQRSQCAGRGRRGVDDDSAIAAERQFGHDLPALRAARRFVRRVVGCFVQQRGVQHHPLHVERQHREQRVDRHLNAVRERGEIDYPKAQIAEHSERDRRYGRGQVVPPRAARRVGSRGEPQRRTDRTTHRCCRQGNRQSLDGCRDRKPGRRTVGLGDEAGGELRRQPGQRARGCEAVRPECSDSVPVQRLSSTRTPKSHDEHRREQQGQERQRDGQRGEQEPGGADRCAQGVGAAARDGGFDAQRPPDAEDDAERRGDHQVGARLGEGTALAQVEHEQQRQSDADDADQRRLPLRQCGHDEQDGHTGQEQPEGCPGPLRQQREHGARDRGSGYGFTRRRDVRRSAPPVGPVAASSAHPGAAVSAELADTNVAATRTTSVGGQRVSAFRHLGATPRWMSSRSRASASTFGLPSPVTRS